MNMKQTEQQLVKAVGLCYGLTTQLTTSRQTPT